MNSTEDQYNFVTENTNWTNLNTLKSQKLSALSGATPSQTLRLLETIGYINFQMSDIVGYVLMNLGESDSLIEPTWLSRAHPGVMEITDLINMWYAKNFDGIDSLIGSSSNEDAEALLLASSFLQRVLDTTRTLYSLSKFELDTLRDIATSSFGDYTNIVRDYLRVEYNIDIPWPVERLNITPREAITLKAEFVSKQNYTIVENPSTGCFLVKSTDNIYEVVGLKIFDLNGKQLKTDNIPIGKRICFDDLHPGMYILSISDPILKISESHKIIIY